MEYYRIAFRMQDTDSNLPDAVELLERLKERLRAVAVSWGLALSMAHTEAGVFMRRMIISTTGALGTSFCQVRSLTALTLLLKLDAV
jgi:hypothetical protein